jgi:hypothetical protein
MAMPSSPANGGNRDSDASWWRVADRQPNLTDYSRTIVLPSFS